MADPASTKPESAEKLRDATSRKARETATAVWLFFLYAGSIIAVLIAMSAFQLQYNIRTFDAGGQSLAVWKVLLLRESWNHAQSARSVAAGRLEAAQKDAEQANQRMNDATARSTTVDRSLTHAEEALRAVLLPSGLAVDPTREPSTALIMAYAQLPLATKSEPDVKATHDVFIAALETSNAATDGLAAGSAAAANALNVLNDRRKELDEANTGVDQVFAAYKDKDPRIVDAIGDFLTQLNYLTQIPGGSFFEFGAMANDMLTLILVLAMGILGGTLHLTRIYLDGEQRGFSYYIFRPLLGAITALSVYIVARAGIFVFSDPSASGPRSPLSPFFISFLAIISGLLAERALLSIQNMGARWFSSAEEQKDSRFARGVAGEIEKQKRNIAEIQALLDVDPATTAGWLKENTAVPRHAQATIAAWLGKPIRDLFSDLPPPEAAGS